ncbi:hypothetical protein EI555_004849, partial [Monodon monoceros]
RQQKFQFESKSSHLARHQLSSSEDPGARRDEGLGTVAALGCTSITERAKGPYSRLWLLAIEDKESERGVQREAGRRGGRYRADPGPPEGSREEQPRLALGPGPGGAHRARLSGGAELRAPSWCGRRHGPWSCGARHLCLRRLPEKFVVRSRMAPLVCGSGTGKKADGGDGAAADRGRRAPRPFGRAHVLLSSGLGARRPPRRRSLHAGRLGVSVTVTSAYCTPKRTAGGWPGAIGRSGHGAPANRPAPRPGPRPLPPRPPALGSSGPAKSADSGPWSAPGSLPAWGQGRCGAQWSSANRPSLDECERKCEAVKVCAQEGHGSSPLFISLGGAARTQLSTPRLAPETGGEEKGGRDWEREVRKPGPVEGEGPKTAVRPRDPRSERRRGRIPPPRPRPLSRPLLDPVLALPSLTRPLSWIREDHCHPFPAGQLRPRRRGAERDRRKAARPPSRGSAPPGSLLPGQGKVQAPLPASLEGPCAFTASHLDPSDNRATLVPLTQRDPAPGPDPAQKSKPKLLPHQAEREDSTKFIVLTLVSIVAIVAVLLASGVIYCLRHSSQYRLKEKLSGPGGDPDPDATNAYQFGHY